MTSGNLGGFNAAAVDPTDQFDILPAGDYPVMIVDSEMKPTKDNRGQYLQLTLEVIEGNYQGRKMWDRLNLDNPNQQAVEIAQRALSQICHAIGRLQVQDSSELHNQPLVARVKVRPARGQYSESNEVAQYKAYGGQPQPGNVNPGPQPPANQPPAHQPVANPGPPPENWPPQQNQTPPPAAQPAPPAQQQPQGQPEQPVGNAAVPPWQRQ